MAMPSSHLVAFCSDLGIAPAQGAAMLSVMLGCAFVSRQFWGWFGDRFGGLRTVMAGSACQDAGDRLLPADAERGRLVRRRRRLRAGLFRHHPVLRAGDPRPVSVSRGVLAHPDAAVHRDVRHGVRKLAGRRAVRPFRATTRRRSRPAWCSTWATWSWWACWYCASAAGSAGNFPKFHCGKRRVGHRHSFRQPGHLGSTPHDMYPPGSGIRTTMGSDVAQRTCLDDSPAQVSSARLHAIPFTTAVIRFGADTP